MIELLDDEQQLVDRARQGDHEAFSLLMQRSALASKRLATSILRDSSAAEDAVQEALARAWEHVPNFHGDSKFSTWLTRIVVNQCLMAIRRTRRRPTVPLESQSDDRSMAIPVVDLGPDPEEMLASRQMRDVVRREVSRLPRLLREPLEMRDLEERPLEEIAKRLELTVPAVKSRLLRARAEMRQRLLRHLTPAMTAPIPDPS